MDPNIIVTILFVSYAVLACLGIGSVLLAQQKRGATADATVQPARDCRPAEPGASRGNQS
jgi:hypothetical protein